MRIALLFALLSALAISSAAAQQQAPLPPSGSGGGYYKPVNPQPQTGPPCGHYGTAPCKAQVTIAPGASAESLFQLGANALQNRQPSAAAAYFEASANMGYVRAEAALGFEYVNGTGVPIDLQKGIHWLTLAAQQGSRGAESQLGQFYEEGTGVPKDQARAIALYKSSAEQHFFQAERSLGIDYELGNGVPRSRAQALVLLKRAADDGNDASSAKLYNMLLHAPATRHFANFDELAAAANPPAPTISQSAPPGCHAMSDFALPQNAGLFCRKNPGCNFHVRELNSEYTHAPGWWYQCSTTISGAYTQIR
jgi:TPR repeat protein